MFRKYIVTLNNPLDWKESLKKFWDTGKFRYIIGQLEKAPATGTLHLQAFIHSFESIRITTLNKIVPGAHYEPVTKDNGAAAYCGKEETRVEGPQEYGEPVPTAKEKGLKGAEARKARNAEILKIGPLAALREGLLDLKEYDRYKKCIGLVQLDQKVLTATMQTRGVWIYGEPGTGKSHYARDTYKDAFVKSQNKWWDGYNGEENVILDDFDEGGKCLGHYLKIWADKWEATGEIKGGTVPLLFKKFVITSNYQIENLWEKEPILMEAIYRRFEIINVYFDSNGDRIIRKIK